MALKLFHKLKTLGFYRSLYEEVCYVTGGY